MGTLRSAKLKECNVLLEKVKGNRECLRTFTGATELQFSRRFRCKNATGRFRMQVNKCLCRIADIPI